MALLMVKKSAAVAPVVKLVPKVQEPVPSAVEILTAEYITLHKKFVYFEVKDLTKRMDDIRKQLHTVANETMDGKKPAIFTCAEGEVEFSERTNAAIVPDPLGLLEILIAKFGVEVAASVVGIALEPLRKILSEHELKEYLKDTPGSRRLQSVRPVV